MFMETPAEHLMEMSMQSAWLQDENMRSDFIKEQTTILLDTSQQVKNKNYIADKIFLHAIIGAEINFGKVFRISFAYNHQRRQELAFENRKGLAGFSFGAGLKINRFSFSYGRAIYNLAGGVNQFSLSMIRHALFGKEM